jgi:putative ABC transport system substrate-binding protein
VLHNPAITSGTGQFAAIQAVAPSFGVELTAIDVRDLAEMDCAVAAFARAPNGGLISTASQAAEANRDVIIALAARHRLPAVYSSRVFVAAGGLISYSTNLLDSYRRAAG